MVRTSALGQKQERRDERHAPGRTHPGSENLSPAATPR